MRNENKAKHALACHTAAAVSRQLDSNRYVAGAAVAAAACTRVSFIKRLHATALQVRMSLHARKTAARIFI